MHPRERLHNWLDIRPGEGRPTSLMLLHSFFTGTSTVFFETAASALFLSHYDASLLPFVYLAAALVSIATGFGYTRVKEHVAFGPLMFGTLTLMLAMTCLARLGLSLGEAGWLIFSMMIGYRLLSILTDLEFWAVATRLYDVQQAKRLFGLVGSGEVGARIVGAFSVPLLVGALGVENLIWLSAAGLAACLVFLTIIFRKFPEVGSREVGDAVNAVAKTGERRRLRSLLGNQYLKAIFLLAFFAVLGKYFVDFAFLSQMQTRSREVENLASFFGLFSGVTQVANLLIRVLVSGRLLNRFGILVGLLVLPVMHALCTLGILAVASVPLPIAVFWLTIGNQALYKTLKHPVDNPSFKVLYQPLPRRERLGAQIMVEVIVTPMAIGLAAALMLLFTHPAVQSESRFAYLMLANFVGWCVVAFYAFREYRGALVRALEKRSLDRTSFSLADEKSIGLVRKKLQSERADEVIFALDLLQRIDHPSLDLHFQELLSHSSPDVRFYVLLQIEKRRPRKTAPGVAIVVNRDPSPRVKAVALRALAALGDPSRQVSLFLGFDDREVERGALVGLLDYPQDPHTEQARDRLRELSASSVPEDRVLAARVVGDTDAPDLDLLQRLLQDDHDEVRRSALRAAGRRRDGAFVERMIDDLADSRFRGHAARAITDTGEAAAPLLARALVDETRPLTLRVRVAQLVARGIPFPDRQALWKAYESGKGRLRREALLALSAQGFRVGEVEAPLLARAIEEEVQEAAWKIGILRDVEAEPGLGALSQSLAEDVDESRERVFLILSFLYDRRTIESARDNLDSASKEKRAYAAEILEVTLSQELKELALPLLEHASVAERQARLEHRFPQRHRGREDSLLALLERSDGHIRNWTRACAIYGSEKLGAEIFAPQLRRLAKDGSPLIAETAGWASGSRNSASNGRDRMLTIEKVLLLKGVSMFAATSEDTLADVASVLEEVELEAGETIFRKGDPGDSMYIIVSGRVRVYDGAKTINYLGEREIFGELALLDPEPRSASVEAFEETRLFRLDRDTLFELMTDNVGVVSGIMQVLCQRLRRMTGIATGNHQ